MEETLLILREKFKANPIIRWKKKEFWSNDSKLFVIHNQTGKLLRMYPMEDLTDEMIGFELN